jgi:hypothetical protein
MGKNDPKDRQQCHKACEAKFVACTTQMPGDCIKYLRRCLVKCATL